MFDKLIAGIDRGMQALSDVFRGPVGAYCRLETVDRDALVADDGSLISVLRLEGSLKHVGVNEYNNIILTLTEKLQSSFSKPGHVIQCVFEFDPEQSRARVDELFEPSKITARNLGLDIGSLLDNWAGALSSYCAVETCWLVIWTRPSVLPDALKKPRSRSGRRR